MKTREIFKGKKDEISCTIEPSIAGEMFSNMYEKSVQISYSQDTYWLEDEKGRIEVKGNTSQDISELSRIAENENISLIIKGVGSKAEIKSKLLTGVIIIPDAIEIGINDIIVDDIDKRFYHQRANMNHADWLSEELVIKENDALSILIDNTPSDSGFRIFGKMIAVDVKKNSDDKFEIIRILKWNNRFNPIFLLKGKIEIKDISQTGEAREEIELELGKINSTERYIKTWEKYQEKEKENSIKEIEKRGFLTVHQVKRTDENMYKLFFRKNENTINWLEIEVNSSVDLNIKQNFPDYTSYQSNNKERTIVTLISKTEDFLLVRSENEINMSDSSNLYACLSLIGDERMNDRRSEALKKIKNNSTPMPTLSAVLEGVDYKSIVRRRIKPLTINVKNEFGKNGPNEMQELALDVAINSPDITIIQGPPGTGKTKVISALAKRLTEIYQENGQAPEMNILLTAFQHDAVENLASRTEVLGLPVIKFSNRHNQSIDVIEKWIINQSEKIEANQSQIEPNEYELNYKNIVGDYLTYIKTLDQDRAKNDLIKIRNGNLAILPDNILDDISNLTKTELNIDKVITEKIIENLNNIRTDEISYKDDGEINLRRFLNNFARYKEELPQIGEKVICEFQNIFELDNYCEIDFTKLNSIKLALLDELKSAEINVRIKLSNSKIESLFKKLIDFFSVQIKSNGSIYSVLSEFQNDLQSNNERVKDTIQNYVALAASTVQGSKAKKLTAIKPDPFDTVIVDEAARANPLDLLIPLTSAKRRIILVGDHRQLPHIVDNAIQKELEEDVNAAKNVSKFLEDSLFERFYNILKKLQEKDGIQRVVTLNTQYRMHPIIGDFISRTFYEKYDDPKIISGTSAELLKHNILPYLNKVAVSINIPNIKGTEKTESGSKFRPIEAKEAIRRAKEILDTDSSISVGIITFYSRQVKELFIEAQKVGIAEKNENGDNLIAKSYLKTIRGEERLRIGSVDAFQGKEFDIVILSLVRSNTLQINNDKEIKNKYGFLTSYNRLNVAMSRAKKLLIAVGDEDMFKIEEAKENVFGLFAFYNELIYSDYGVSI